MKQMIVDPNKPDHASLSEAVGCLKKSGILAHATETVYGLAVLWDDWEAIQRLSILKNRSLLQPYSLMVSSREDIIRLAGWESDQFNEFLKALFPGPVTLVLAHQQNYQLDFWKQFTEIGIRMPDHQISHQLVRQAGSPLVTTSANISGEPAVSRAEDLSPGIVNGVDLLLNSGLCLLKVPSTVIKINWLNKHYQVLRYGAYPLEKFQQVLKKIC